MAGCTEIGLLISKNDVKLPVFDTSPVAPIRPRLVCLGLLNPDECGRRKSLQFQRAGGRLGHGIRLPHLKGLRCGLGQYGYYLSKSV